MNSVKLESWLNIERETSDEWREEGNNKTTISFNDDSLPSNQQTSSNEDWECFKLRDEYSREPFGRLSGSLDGNLLLGILFKLLAQVLPVLDHQLLNTQQGFVAHIGVVVGEQLHNELLTAKVFSNTASENKKEMNTVLQECYKWASDISLL